jgi:hypothetical protein
MNERASRLHGAADEQIGELLDLVSTLDAATSRLPVPGRAKLGDGTVAANARHTTDNYQRIAAFASETERVSATHMRQESLAHRKPSVLRILRHRPPDAEHGHSGDPGEHDARYTADDTDLGALIEQIGTTRGSLAFIAELSDRQLDAIPSAGSFRFADGKRSLEQILAGLLKHQRHQLDALEAATAAARSNTAPPTPIQPSSETG